MYIYIYTVCIYIYYIYIAYTYYINITGVDMSHNYMSYTKHVPLWQSHDVAPPDRVAGWYQRELWSYDPRWGWPILHRLARTEISWTMFIYIYVSIYLYIYMYVYIYMLDTLNKYEILYICMQCIYIYSIHVHSSLVYTVLSCLIPSVINI